MEDLGKPVFTTIEHLVGGVQPVVWVLALMSYQPDLLQRCKEVTQNFQTPAVILALAMLYPLGVFLDEVADALLRGWSARIRKRRFEKHGLGENAITAFGMLASDRSTFLRQYFDSSRSRIRLSRLTALNAGLALVAAVVARGCYQLPTGPAILAAAVMLTISLWSWWRFESLFAGRIAQEERRRRSEPGLVSPVRLDAAVGRVAPEAAGQSTPR